MVALVVLLTDSYLNTERLSKQIASLNRATVVYWMLPSDSKCNVRQLSFLTSKGVKYPANMMLCNFDAALAQPIRPKPRDPLDILQEKYQSGEMDD